MLHNRGEGLRAQLPSHKLQELLLRGKLRWSSQCTCDDRQAILNAERECDVNTEACRVNDARHNQIYVEQMPANGVLHQDRLDPARGDTRSQRHGWPNAIAVENEMGDDT